MPAVWRSDCGEPGHLTAEAVLPAEGWRPGPRRGGEAGVRAGLQRPWDSGRVRRAGRDSGRVRQTGLREGQMGLRKGQTDRTQPQWDSVRLRQAGGVGSVHGLLGAELARRSLACPSRRQDLVGNEPGSCLVLTLDLVALAFDSDQQSQNV